MNARHMLILLALIALGLAACDTGTLASTPTPNRAPAGAVVPASPTVDPVLPTGDGSGGLVIGSSNPTQARLPAEGQPSREAPTLTPQATASALDMAIPGGGGNFLQGTYYSAPLRPAPGVLLLHQAGGSRADWDALAGQLQDAGYVVLTVDLRGHGATPGPVDWTRTPDDAQAALRQLLQFASVIPDQVIIGGAGVGANLALNLCADYPGCAGTVLLSPGLDYHGITTSGALARLGARPLLILASENDNNNPADSIEINQLASGSSNLTIYPAGHGTAILDTAPDAGDAIVEWLRASLPPPSPN
jgi:dienelactone hydrolase